ncbi:hypothetical protein NU219Hw_g4778t1 [Hortaea werneckii]
MLRQLLAPLSVTAAGLSQLAAAQDVFAHVIVGNTFAYDVSQWEADIRQAASYGIDAFVLNVAQPFSGSTATQMSYSFQAANNLASEVEFKMFFSFDYKANGAWSKSDVIEVMTAYGPNGAYYLVDGKPMVSTFEGPDNSSDWPGIRSSLADVTGGIYFVPDWTSIQGSFPVDLVDGACVSPWFYTNLPQYNKAWVWRGDTMWYDRWVQTTTVLPRFVEIVTWNDYGESHYIGPIHGAGIPSGAGGYVNGYPHTAWLETLPYQIAAYKHAYNPSSPAPSVDANKIVYWYRNAPASAGTTDAVGNNCYTDINIYGYQTCYAPSEILQDEVFAIVLATGPTTASITIGSSTQTFDVTAGINFISKPFAGNTGAVSVSMAGGSVSSTGDVEIISNPGVANFNAWVGCAGC